MFGDIKHQSSKQNRRTIIVGLMLAIFLLLGYANCIFAQDVSQDNFKQRITFLTTKKQYNTAIILVKNEIKKRPYDDDLNSLLGRIYAWDKQYSEAKKVLNQVILRNPNHIDSWQTLINIELWQKHYNEALALIQQALQANRGNNVLLYKKAEVLHQSGQFMAAKEILLDLKGSKDIDPTAMNKLLYVTTREAAKNEWLLTDQWSNVSDTTPWNITSLSYSHKANWGKILGRINYANRFGTSGVQYELEAYPNLAKFGYLYLNYGYATSSIFPKNKYATEAFINLPDKFEVSLGMRYLNFQDTIAHIYTGSVGKYLGNYWLSLRPYYSSSKDTSGTSGYLTLRRYFDDFNHYVGIEIGGGTSPDSFDTTQNLINATSRIGVTVTSRLPLQRSFDLLLGADYHMENLVNSKRNIFSLIIGFAWLN